MMPGNLTADGPSSAVHLVALQQVATMVWTSGLVQAAATNTTRQKSVQHIRINTTTPCLYLAAGPAVAILVGAPCPPGHSAFGLLCWTTTALHEATWPKYVTSRRPSPPLACQVPFTNGCWWIHAASLIAFGMCPCPILLKLHGGPAAGGRGRSPLSLLRPHNS